MCSAAATAAATATCDSINWVAEEINSRLGTCTLKRGRNSPLTACPNPSTITYDYNCPTDTPTLAPVTESPTVAAQPLCINFKLMDTFGDGWNRGKFFIYDDKGYYHKETLTCENNPVILHYCFDPQTACDGDSVAVTVSGVDPRHPWEFLIFGYVVDTDQLYTGTYRSFLQFTYHTNNGSPHVVMDNSYNLLTNRVQCLECISGQDPVTDDDWEDQCSSGGKGGGDDDKKKGGIKVVDRKSDDGFGGVHGVGIGHAEDDNNGHSLITKTRDGGASSDHLELGVGDGPGALDGTERSKSDNMRRRSPYSGGVTNDISNGYDFGYIPGYGIGKLIRKEKRERKSLSERLGLGKLFGRGKERAGRRAVKHKASMGKEKGVSKGIGMDTPTIPFRARGRKEKRSEGYNPRVSGKTKKDKSGDMIGISNKPSKERKRSHRDKDKSAHRNTYPPRVDSSKKKKKSKKTVADILTRITRSLNYRNSYSSSGDDDDDDTDDADDATWDDMEEWDTIFDNISDHKEENDYYKKDKSDDSMSGKGYSHMFGGNKGSDDKTAEHYNSFDTIHEDDDDTWDSKSDSSKYVYSKGEKGNDDKSWSSNIYQYDKSSSSSSYASGSGNDHDDDRSYAYDKYDEGMGMNKYYISGRDFSSWCTGDRLGSDFHVSDAYGYHLYHRGTLSWQHKVWSPCDLSNLVTGVTYQWRVTGAFNPYADDVSYEFCGIKGTAQSQIYFEIDCDGECVAIDYDDIEEICDYDNHDDKNDSHDDKTSRGKDDKVYSNYDDKNDNGDSSGYSMYDKYSYAGRYSYEGSSSSADDTYKKVRSESYSMQETPVVLQGTVSLEGVNADSGLSVDDMRVIQATLSHEFSEGKIEEENLVQENVEILSAHLIEKPTISIVTARKLDIGTVHLVNFQVTVFAEHYGVDGSIETADSGLAESLTDYLAHSMRAGLFTAKLVSRAASEGSHSLQSVKHAELTHSMSVIHTTHMNMEISIVANIIIIGGGLAGIIASVLLVLSFNKDRPKNRNKSTTVPRSINTGSSGKLHSLTRPLYQPVKGSFEPI